MVFIHEIRILFSFKNMILVREESRRTRPWLCFIKQLIKSKYNIESIDYRMNDNGLEIITHKYKFDLILRIHYIYNIKLI